MVKPESMLHHTSALRATPDVWPQVERIAQFSSRHAAEVEREQQFPLDELKMLAEGGLLALPLPAAFGGIGMGTEPGQTRLLLSVLARIGWGSLPVGRLYEGHVNALQLLARFGDSGQQEHVFEDAQRNGRVFGVWNTGPAQGGVTLQPDARGGFQMSGSKSFATGAGHIERPIVTGALPDGGWQMCLVSTERAELQIDRGTWDPLGMQPTASYLVDFAGTTLAEEDLIGEPGDYYVEPYFRGGAIRFAAVQLGGTHALADAVMEFLRERRYDQDPYQVHRCGEMAYLVEGGYAWLDRAACLAERCLFGASDPAPFLNCANMTRIAIEDIAMRVLQLAERAVGAQGLLEPHPIGRMVRDLRMYLRQAAPDAALASVGRAALAKGMRHPSEL